VGVVHAKGDGDVFWEGEKGKSGIECTLRVRCREVTRRRHERWRIKGS
jgi:hypothetical protein